MSETNYKNAAHDLNNILTSILNNIYYLKEINDLPDRANKVLLNVENDAKRAADIIATTFLEKQSGRKELQKVTIDEIAEEVITSIQQSLPKDIELTLESSPNIPPIIADKTDIYRIIFNLLKNAVEAIPGEGTIVVNAGYAENNVELDIKDSGEGIKPEHIDKIFDYKFSTKDKDTESGYGLGIVKEKVEAYGGSITVSSDNNGTEFKLTFPAFVKEAKSELKILLAEDDQSVLEVLSDLLESYNYNVTKTTNGNDLVQQAVNESFDLLLIDNKLPGKNGLESIKEIREKGIGITIILASGSDVDQDDDNIIELNIDKIIRKPYSFPEIIDAINKLF